jgi:alcohol dehydrogenase
MQNFTFHNPTKICFGQGRTASIGEMTQFWGQRVLLLYGQGSVKKNGILETVQKSLRAANVSWVELGGVRANPVLGFVNTAIVCFRQEKLDAIVAVGGGSVIDTAKAIAAGVEYSGDVWDFFCGKAAVLTAVPITTVLTLAATASEMNGGGVITNEETQEKYNLQGAALYPKVSILDPVNTFSVPRHHSMYGAVDAIVHILEAYFNASDPHLPIQDRLSEGLILSIMEAAEIIFEQPENYTARANMMWCATLALNGLSTAGTGNTGFPMHMIEHSLSAMYDISHGAGLAMIAPAWLKHASAQDPKKHVQFAERVFGICEGTEAERALAGIHALEQWFARVQAPIRLGEANIPIRDILKIAQNAHRLAGVWEMSEYTCEVIESILKRASA